MNPSSSGGQPPAINLAPRPSGECAGLGSEVRGCGEPDCQRHAHQGVRQHGCTSVFGCDWWHVLETVKD